MTTLLTSLRRLWGKRASAVARQYTLAFDAHPLLETDLAIFCNIGAPNTAKTEFDRGVEEGKRRVFLHIARLRRLDPTDFVAIADGDRV